MIRKPLALSPTWAVAGLVLGLGACTIAPSKVEKYHIDQGIATGAYNVVCKGLEMEDAEVREYAASQLATVLKPAATECLCAHVWRNGVWDEAVAQGLVGATRDEVVGCLAAVLDDPRLDRPAELLAILAQTNAPLVPGKVFAFAQATSDPKARAAAAAALANTGDPAQVDWLVQALGSDTAGEVRAAASRALRGQKGEAIQAAQRRALAEDPDGAVRLEALQYVGSIPAPDLTAVICHSILEDPVPEVRLAGLGLFRGARSKPALECLHKRVFTEEPDGRVREKILEVLTSSPSDEAEDMLCDLVPWWLEHYAADDIIYNIPGLKVMEAQNDRDWRRSLECAQKANARRERFDCYGKQYIAHWVNELGGRAWPPPCPKTDGDKAVYRQAGGGSGVMSFE